METASLPGVNVVCVQPLGRGNYQKSGTRGAGGDVWTWRSEEMCTHRSLSLCFRGGAWSEKGSLHAFLLHAEFSTSVWKAFTSALLTRRTASLFNSFIMYYFFNLSVFSVWISDKFVGYTAKNNGAVKGTATKPCITSLDYYGAPITRLFWLLWAVYCT